MQFRQAFGHLPVEVVQIGQYLLGRRVLYALVFRLRVLVEAEVIVVVDDLLLGNQEALLGALAALLGFKVRPPRQDVRDVVVLLVDVAPVVERETVALHVVQPHVIGSAGVGLREDQYSGAHPGIGLEHAARHVDDGFELLVVHQLAAQLAVGLGVAAEQHAVGDDACSAPADLEHAQE